MEAAWMLDQVETKWICPWILKGSAPDYELERVSRRNCSWFHIAVSSNVAVCCVSKYNRNNVLSKQNLKKVLT